MQYFWSLVYLNLTDTSLADMIEAGLHRIVSQLEEIGATASKEYALEMAMAKMKDEWLNVVFECVPYRESGVSTLAMASNECNNLPVVILLKRLCALGRGDPANAG